MEILTACGGRFPLVEKTFEVSANGYLRSTRKIVDATDLEALLHWITPEILEPLDNALKDRYRKHILIGIRRRLGISLLKQDCESLSKLPIFKKFIACENGPTVYRYGWSKCFDTIGQYIPRYTKLKVTLYLAFHAFQSLRIQIFSMHPPMKTKNFSNLSDTLYYPFKLYWWIPLSRISTLSQCGC